MPFTGLCWNSREEWERMAKIQHCDEEQDCESYKVVPNAGAGRERPARAGGFGERIDPGFDPDVLRHGRGPIEYRQS